MKKLVIALMVIGVVAFAGTSMAATQTSNLNVTAAVQAACSISGHTDVAFGNYDPTSATDNDAGQGSMTFSCTKNTSYHTYITGTRSMSGGGDTLNFQLYSDAGRTTAYPAILTGGGTTAPNTNPITTNIYGRIPNSQNVGVANYTTILVATIEY